MPQNKVNSNTQNFQNTNMPEKSTIVKVRKNSSGDITDVMTVNGSVFSVNEAITMAKNGVLDGVNVGSAKNGREFLRADPNQTTDDNLDSLPTF